MNKNEEKERKSSKEQCRDGKRSKINKSRGNDNKLPPANEKGGKPDSNKFPNFNRLNTEEKLVFFKALNAARKNVEERGVPTRERFGTVHDEYLQHFMKEGESEEETATEKSSSHRNLSVSTSSQPSTCSFLSDAFEELSLTPPLEPSLPDPCEAIIRQDTDSIIDLYLEKKKRNASKWNLGLKEKREKAEQEKKVEESAWPFLMSPNTTGTPQFNALSAEEKSVFFKILEEARKKVVEKNPEKKKEILPLNSIVRMYQGHGLASRIGTPEEKPKNLKVKVTLTSGDNKRIQNKKQKVPELPLAPEKKLKEMSVDVPSQESMITEVKKEESRGDNTSKCSVSNLSTDTKIGTTQTKLEETALRKETPTLSETGVKQETMEEKQSVMTVKSETRSEINPEKASKQASKEAVKRESSVSLEKQHGLMEISSRIKEDRKKKDRSQDEKIPSETVQKIKLKVNSKIIGLSLQEELKSEKDLVSAQEEKVIQECEVRGDEENPIKLREEEECAEKELETPEEKEISGKVCEDREKFECESKEQKEEATVEKCESKWEVDPKTEERNEEVKIVCESLLEKEEKKMEEDVPGPGLGDHAAACPKVMIVDDNVIEKIRNLIYYLEGKARKDGCSEKEYIKLLVEYVDYLSRMLQTLVLKKEYQMQNTFITAEARLKFDDAETKATESRKPQKSPEKLVPRSVSAQALGADALLSFSQGNVKDFKKTPDAIFASDSDISMDVEEDGEDVHFLPPTVGSKKVISTKIRLLQDLLKQRAEFVEGSAENFKIVQHPEEKFVPVDKPPTVKLLKEDQEETEDQEENFFKAFIRCLTCGKKKEDEGIYENLKGEVVRVDVSEGRDDPANATLNHSTMEVLKAVARKKIIDKYYSTE